MAQLSQISMANFQFVQRIARLTPLDDVLAMMNARVNTGPAQEIETGAAAGRILAADVVATHDIPVRPIALRDGVALRADLTADASAYAPTALPDMAVRVDAGDALPADADAVAPPEAVTQQNERCEVIAVTIIGDGVQPIGGDVRAGQILRRAGEGIRPIDVTTLTALGLTKVSIRAPRVRVVPASKANETTAITAMVAAAVTAEGGQTEKSPDVESALNDPGPDAVIAIGGTGNGRNDASVAMLARIGTVAAHGIGLQPGETSAFGFVANRPVLLLPGRCDAALSAWLTLGRRLMALLTGRAEQSCSAAATLTRKITSTIGIADVVLVRFDNGQAEPLAQGYWPMNALTRANGWTVIPAGHEGLPAGATVQVNALT